MSWKNSFLQNSLLRKVFSLQTKKKNISLKTWSRSSTIIPQFVGFRFRVYNGKDFIPVVVTPEMVGFKLGEFATTRARYVYKKKKKSKKK
jgi:small subunit ribosomal protein S19